MTRMGDNTTLSSDAKHDDSIVTATASSQQLSRFQQNKTSSEKDGKSCGERSSPILTKIIRKRRSNDVVEDSQSQQQQQQQRRSNDHLKSINSGFLAGLFDDVTKMNVLKELKISSSTSSCCSPDATNTIAVEERHSTNNCSGDWRKEIISAAPITTWPPVAAAAAAATRTVSPSTHNNSKEAKTTNDTVGMETTTTTTDPFHLLDSLATSSAGRVSMTSSSYSCCFSNTNTSTNSRPAKKSRLSMIKVPSLTGLHASTESMRCNLERVSYWNLTERSATLQAQSRELFQTCISSSAGVGGHDNASQSNANNTTTPTLETSLNRLFSQVSFLDDAQQHDSASMMMAATSSSQPEQITISNNNNSSNPATLALDALTGTCTTTIKKHLSRMIKASTLNRFPVLPYTISATSCDNNNNINNDARRRTKLTRSNPTSACDTISSSNSNLDEGAFGWFVDTDDHPDDSTTTAVAPSTDAVASTAAAVKPSSTSGSGGDDLAFQAPTAPKGRSIQCDAEVEWAQAADTVDSVLGDMF